MTPKTAKNKKVLFTPISKRDTLKVAEDLSKYPIY